MHRQLVFQRSFPEAPQQIAEVVDGALAFHQRSLGCAFYVVVLDLAGKAVSLHGDQTPEGLLDFGIDSLHPGLTATFQHLMVHRHPRNSSIERLARAVCRHCI